ncbi:MAG TPA: Flp family type IVb pilin [Polyangia bacterium]|jgi:Flp pilus assembly pilin Flp|nr:Flp family type IVb pilin [Polyangia bacterium]
MRRDLKHFLADQSGATAVEYALILAAVAGLIMVVVFTLGGKVKNSFDKMQKGMP